MRGNAKNEGDDGQQEQKKKKRIQRQITAAYLYLVVDRSVA